MSNIPNFKTSLDEYIAQLSESNLELVYQFISDLVKKEKEEATIELSEISDLREDIEVEKQDIQPRNLTSGREIRAEYILKYRQTAQKNWQLSSNKRKLRRQKAWQLAQQSALLLKEQFHVKKVVVFGSLLRENCFNLWSDVDVAAWGILPQDTFLAMERVKDLSQEIEINLVDIETCSQELKEVIETEGYIL